jgi:hypothetical protein
MKILGWTILAVLGAVCLSGFFVGAAAPRVPQTRASGAASGLDLLELPQPPLAAAPPSAPRLLARVDSPEYRRSADLSLKVADCVKAEDELEAKLEKIRGEIVEMAMEGTEGARRCTLRVLVPSPSFRGFVSELRGMGKVQSEKIQASKIRGGGAPAVGEIDARELCLVAVRMADERVAQSVLEGKGNLASSFDRSASHLLNGVSVLVEGLGYVLPFGLAGAALLLPALLARRLRRARLAA